MSDELAMRVLDEVRALRAEVAELRAVAGTDRLVGKRDAAELMQISLSTFDRMRARGTAPEPASGDERSLRWRVADILRWRRG